MVSSFLREITAIRKRVALLLRTLPLILGVGTSIITVLLWYALIQQEQAQIQHALAVEAEDLEMEITDQLEPQVEALIRMAERWQHDGRPSQEEWEFNAALNVRDFRSYQALAWADPSHQVRWIVPLRGNEAALNLELDFEARRKAGLDAAYRQRTVAVSRAINLVQGGKGFQVYVPIFTDQRFDGFIVATYRTQTLISDILTEKDTYGYEISVFDGEEEIYTHPDSDNLHHGQWHQESKITLHGLNWRVRVSPTATLLNHMRSPLPSITLIAGLALSWLLALALHWADRARLTTHNEIAINSALQQEIGERQRIEATLQEKQEFLQVLLNTIEAGIVACDAKGTLTLFNRATREWHGLPEQPLPAEQWAQHYNLYHWDGKTLMKKEEIPLFRALQGEAVRNVEMRIEPQQGQTRMVLSSGQSIINAQGQKLGAVVVMHDITDRKQSEIDLQESEGAIRALYEITAAYELSFEERFQQLLAMGCQHFNLDFGFLAHIQGNCYEVVSVQTPDQSAKKGDLFDVRQAYCLETFKSDVPICIEYASQSQWCQHPGYTTFGMESYIGMNVKVSGETYGVLCFCSRSPVQKPFKPVDKQILKLMTQWVGGELEQQRAANALQRQLERADLLKHITDQIRQSLDTEQIFKTAAIQIGRAFGVSRCLIHTYILEPIPQKPLVAEYLTPGYSSMMGMNIPIVGNLHAERMMAQDGAIASPDVFAEPLLQAVAPICHQIQLKSMLAVRTSYQGEANGAIGLHQCDRFRQWTNDEIELLESVASQVGIALAQADLLDQETRQREELAVKGEELTLKNFALEQARRAAETATQAKSEFLAMMSHELRTPLNVILGFTQVMAHDTSLTSSQQEDLQTIRRSGDHLLSLINDVLDLSKIESGHCTLEETSFDLIALLHTLRTMMTERAKSKQIQLKFEITPEVPQFVIADAQKLRQILLNLLSNAIKFTNHGGVVLRVTSLESNHTTCLAPSLSRSDSPLQTSKLRLFDVLQFEVIDTGVGIVETEQANIFDAFVQAGAGKKATSGTGLGLTISRKLLTLMNGTISIQSTPNIGSTFTVTVPVCSTSGTHVSVEQPDRAIIGLAPGQPHYRILVVDDQRENRLVLVRLLTLLGLEVREAANGQDAIRIWQDWQPKLTWMDIQMPDLDGYEATRQIRAMEHKQASIIIALTAQASQSDRTLALTAGCNDYISKPFQEATIFLKMREYLGLEYLYAEPTSPSTTLSVESSSRDTPLSALLDPTVLAQLPTDWLADLEDAAVRGDDGAIAKHASQLPLELAPLSVQLTELADKFQFEQILQQIHSSSAS